jgi:hypothetical protein
MPADRLPGVHGHNIGESFPAVCTLDLHDFRSRGQTPFKRYIPVHNNFVSSVGLGTLMTSTRKTALLSFVHRCGIRAGLSTS